MSSVPKLSHCLPCFSANWRSSAYGVYLHKYFLPWVASIMEVIVECGF